MEYTIGVVGAVTDSFSDPKIKPLTSALNEQGDCYDKGDAGSQARLVKQRTCDEGTSLDLIKGDDDVYGTPYRIFRLVPEAPPSIRETPSCNATIIGVLSVGCILPRTPAKGSDP